MSKKNLVLGGILILLITLAYIYQGPLKEWRQNLGKSDNFLAGIDAAGVTGIEIMRDDKKTALIKSGDKWKIEGTKDFYVKDSLTANLEESLKNATMAEVELVSTNKDNKGDFQTDERGTMVKLKQGDTVLIEFVIGELASDFVSTYISKIDIDETYALKANIYSAFNPGDWYDKTIFSVDQEKITKVRFQYPTQEFTIEKQEEEWIGILPYTFDVDQDKIKEILNIMSNLSAFKIPEQTFIGTGLEKHSIIVQAIGEDIDNTLIIGDLKKEEEEGDIELYYAKKGDSDNIYVITKSERDELNKRINDLE